MIVMVAIVIMLISCIHKRTPPPDGDVTGVAVEANPLSVFCLLIIGSSSGSPKGGCKLLNVTISSSNSFLLPFTQPKPYIVLICTGLG